MADIKQLLPSVIRDQYLAKFTLIVILVIGLVGVGGLTMVTEASDTLETQQRTQVATNAQLNANQTAKWVANHRQTVRMLSQFEALRDRDFQGAQAELEEELERLPPEVSEIHYIVLEDPVGTNTNASHAGGPIVASTDQEEVGKLFGEHGATWQRPLAFESANETRVSYVYQHDGDKQVAFASKVEGTRRAIVLTVKATTHANSFRTGIDGSTTQVVDESGTVQFDKEAESVLSPYQYGSSFEGIERAKGGESGVILEDADNRLVAYAPVPGTEWILLTHTPTSSAYQVVDDVRQNVLLVIGLSLAGFLFIGVTIGRSTVSELTTLAAKARELENGNLDAEVQSDRTDELGQLYDAFAEMRDALDQQITDAKQARKEAEVSRAETMEMNATLQETAEQYSDVMRECAAGDMTQRMSVTNDHDSMDRIATEFNGMIEELEKTTGQLETFADEVAESGDIVLQSAESVRDASEQVADSIQKISDDAYAQQDRLQGLAEDIDALVETLDHVDAEHSDVDLADTLDEFRAVATTLQDATDTSEATMGEAENVAGAAEEQAAELNEVTLRADRLKRYVRPLGDILGRFETNAEHEFVFSGGSSAAKSEQRDS